MAIKNTLPSPFELKLKHRLEQKPEAKDFTVGVNAKIFRQGCSTPFEEIFFSSAVQDFIWEDEDCPEKVALYELLVDSGITEFEAQFLLIDIILYVCEKTRTVDEEYKGLLSLTVEVTLPKEPVEELNHVGSEQTQPQKPIATTKMREQRRRWLKPKQKIQKATYKIGADGVSLVLVKH
ncbi:uncharacterized protein LOC18994334 [Eutrema salsugineum]|uniref:uncharacterized protein LOC18994334 n=1 Tax=Eutrema salsugineum TaxID=72664 RepID=UPI000CED7D5C|nr:uncharacterized protein LOC18994334 [Eutrema salsugineum]